MARLAITDLHATVASLPCGTVAQRHAALRERLHGNDATLDGLELTLWLVVDFYHLVYTSKGVDSALVQFNARQRCHELSHGLGVLPGMWCDA